MQTPAGFFIEDGQFHIESWWAIIFNPSFPYRFMHMLLACLLTAAFLVAGISAFRCLRGVDGPATRKVMKTGVVIAAAIIPLQIFVGDLHGVNTFEYQPAKVAAMEAVWETEQGAAFTLFGFPDADARTTHAAVKIPYAASLVLTHELDGEVPGLAEFGSDHPPVAPVFWSFRIMIAVAMAMLVVSWWSTWQIWRGNDFTVLTMRVLSWMTFSGWVAVLAGWYVSEVGRQPWIIYGQLRVSEVVADHAGGTVLTTLIAYTLLYGFLLISYVAALRHMATKPSRSMLESQQPGFTGGGLTHG